MPVEGREIRHPIETERLLLRAFEPGDLEPLLALHGDADLVRWIPWGPRSREEVREALDRKLTQTEFRDPGGGIALAIVLPGGSNLVGELTLAYSSREHSMGEVGFMLLREHQGKGYVTEGAREMLRIGFKELDLHRIVGRIDARNAGSAAVLEQLGMRREAHLVDNEWIKDEWTSEHAYAILEREWASGRGRRARARRGTR